MENDSWYFDAQLEIGIRGRIVVPRSDILHTSMSGVLEGLSELLYWVRYTVGEFAAKRSDVDKAWKTHSGSAGKQGTL